MQFVKEIRRSIDDKLDSGMTIDADNTRTDATNENAPHEARRFVILAPRPGLEPGTYGLTVRRSTDGAIGESLQQRRNEF